MNFKQYYHNRLEEDGNFMREPLDVDAPVAQQNVPQKPAENNGAVGMLSTYVSADQKLKVSLTKLGQDLGKAIAEYAKNQLVTRDDFKSDDDYLQYCNIIRDTIEEKYNVTLTETLKNMGIFIDNKANERAI